MKHFILIIILVYCWKLPGQQLPALGLYREYLTYLNPAALPHDYFREDRNVQIGFSHRKQWTNFGDDGPLTSLIHGTFIGDQLNTKLIVGGTLFHDQAAALKNFGINGKLGVMFSEDPLYGGFSAALTFGYKFTTIDITKLTTSNGQPLNNLVDNYFRGTPDIGLGAFYHHRLDNEDNFYLGVSMPQLLSVNSVNNSDPYIIHYLPHYNLLGGYIKYLNDYSFLETSGWVRYVQYTKISADFNIKFQIDKPFWFGGGFSTSKAVKFDCGVVLGQDYGAYNTIRIGYSFENGFNEIANPFGNTHEISLNYSFDSRR